MDKWIENLKVGDRVIWFHRDYTKTVETVSRLTATRVAIHFKAIPGISTAHDVSFLKRNGCQIPYSEYGSNGYIREWSQGAEDAITKGKEINRLVNVTRGCLWHKIGIEKLRRIVEIIEDSDQVQRTNAFWYDPEDREINVCATLDGAKTEAQKYLDQAHDGDGWEIDEDTIAEVVIGFITHRAALHRSNATDEDIESGVVESKDVEIWSAEIEEVK